MRSSDRRILVVTCFGHFLSHVNMLVFPALVLPLAARLELSMAAVLAISFWMYLLFGVTALPWGMLTDRWGAPCLLFLYHTGAALSCVAAALWIDDPTRLSLALAALGLFSGIYHPAGLGWISRRLERVSIGLGYNGMFGNLGIAVAPLLAGILNYLWGPEMAYVAVAGLNVVGALSVLLSPREKDGDAADDGAERDGGMLGPFLILLVAMMLGGTRLPRRHRHTAGILRSGEPPHLRAAGRLGWRRFRERGRHRHRLTRLRRRDIRAVHRWTCGRALRVEARVPSVLSYK